MTLFDPEEGDRRKREGIGRSSDAANLEWKAAAKLAIWHCAVTFPEFTTDQVWAELKDESPSKGKRQAMGARMQEAAKLGWITITDRTLRSERAVAHRNPKQIWRSNLYRGES